MKASNLKNILSLLPLILLLVTCKTREEQPDHSEIVEEIKSTLVDMWAAIENEDLELYASFVHPNFTQFGETDPTLLIGKEAEVTGTANWIKSSKNIHTEMEDPRVTVNGDVAWITYYWKDHGTTNGEAFSSRGKSTRIFVREKGKWLCIHGHYTLLEPNSN